MTDDWLYRTTFLVNMADSSDEDAAAAVFVMLHTRRKRKKRKIWVRPWYVDVERLRAHNIRKYKLLY